MVRTKLKMKHHFPAFRSLYSFSPYNIWVTCNPLNLAMAEDFHKKQVEKSVLFGLNYGREMNMYGVKEIFVAC